MFVSSAKLDANRQNAQSSTGPVTPEGKKRSSLNATVHGFASQVVVMPDHEMPAFQEIFQNFFGECRPKTHTEHFLVQSLAEITWQLSKIRAQETNIMTLFNYTGASPIKTGDERGDLALNQAKGTLDHAKQLNTLSIYEQRKMRLFRETLKELISLQAARKTAEIEDLNKAAAYRKAMQTNNPTWQPAEDGFVHSLEQIDAFIQRDEREHTVKTHRATNRNN